MFVLHALSPHRALAVAFVLAVLTLGAGWVAAADAQTPGPCTEPGSWLGVADNGFKWMNIITRGQDATSGQLDLAWVIVDPTLGGAFPNAARVTPARGVWKKTSARDALWTWTSYGLDDGGTPAYVIRASGTHHMADCDHLEISYTLDVFLPSQNMATDAPIASLQGTALETRMLLVESSAAVSAESRVRR